MEEAVTRANGIFAGALRDRLAVGAAATSIYPDHPDLAALAQVPPLCAAVAACATPI